MTVRVSAAVSWLEDGARNGSGLCRQSTPESLGRSRALSMSKWVGVVLGVEVVVTEVGRTPMVSPPACWRIRKMLSFRNRVLWLALFLLFLASCCVSEKWKAGDRVLADRSGDEFWYAARVKEVKADRAYVVFDDGDKEWLPSVSVLEMDLEVGEVVHGNWRELGTYYRGKITDMEEGADEGEGKIHVAYDDGDVEWTTTRLLRVTR